MYGFGASHSPKISFASSSLTEPAMITLSPCFHCAGVATLCFAVSCSEAGDLDAALAELRLDRRHGAELGRADGREVLRMGEEDGPGVADPVVEADRSFGRLCLEIRCGVAERQCHASPPLKLSFLK